MSKRLRILLGPTGVGKTAVGVRMAKEIGCPVVSCDSRQIYRELIIGTAAPTVEEMEGVPHFFIGSHSIFDHFTAGAYEVEALALLEKLFRDHDEVLMVGGSGLYIDAVCNGIDDFPPPDLILRARLNALMEMEGAESLCLELKRLDPESYNTIDIKNPQRVARALEVTMQTGRPFSSFKTFTPRVRSFEVVKEGLMRERSALYTRIESRVDQMMERGLLEEVKALRPYKELPALRTVGYRELFDYLEGKCSLASAILMIKQNTRRYAKRQCTYWRRDNSIKWMFI